MHITENLTTRGSWEENVLRESWGTVKGLSPSPSLSWTKSLFVLGVSSWFFCTCNFQGSSKRKSSKKWPYGSQHIKHQWAPDGKLQEWQSGQLVGSLPQRQNAIFWQPSCRNRKVIILLLTKKIHTKTSVNFKNLTAWKGGRQGAWKQQEARYRGINRKM